MKEIDAVCVPPSCVVQQNRIGTSRDSAMHELTHRAILGTSINASKTRCKAGIFRKCATTF